MSRSRTKASRSPGSGGRHQQIGGPPPCGHSAVSTGPLSSAASRAPSAARSCARPSGLQSRAAPAPPTLRAARSPPPRPPLGARRARRTGRECLPATVALERHAPHDRESLVRRRRLELAPSAHLRRRREHPRLGLREPAELLRFGQGAEAVEQPLDEIDLCLSERGCRARRTRPTRRGARRPRPRGCATRG